MSADYDVVVLSAGPGGYTAAVLSTQLGAAPRPSRPSTGAARASTSSASRPRALLRNAELAHTATQEADLFGIRSETPITLDYGRSGCVGEF